MDTPELRSRSDEARPPVPSSVTWTPPLPEAAGFAHLVVETPGLRMHVATIGDGEPIVLLHGFPQHWWQWRVVAPRLAAAGYRAICPDLRGAGWTTTDDPRLDRESRLRDLTALLDRLGLDRVGLVCHDMGAITGMQLAYDQPERVRAAVMLSVPPGFMSFSPKIMPAMRHMPPLVAHRPGRSLRWLWNDESAAQPMSDATVDAYLTPLERLETDAAVPTLYRRMVLPEAMRIMRGAYKRQRLLPPALFAFGASDGPFSETLVRRLCGDTTRYAEHVEFAFVDDAAHFITDDAPVEVADLTLDFFSRVG